MGLYAPKLVQMGTGRLVAWLLLAGWAALPLEAEVLLLHGGAVLQGEVQAEGDQHVVRRQRSEIRIPSTRVATQATTLGELYAWQRDQRRGAAASLGEHLALAEWCLRQSLWIEASRELLDARQLAPDSRRVALLERRLMLLSQPKQPISKQTAPAAESPPAGRAALPRLRLPEGASQHFSRRIQPLLVNNCTDGGCHRKVEQEHFVLDTQLRHGLANARSTETNLRAVLQTIDPEDPMSSPLLVAARGPHAGGSPLVGPRREEWLQRLEAWVTTIAEANRPQSDAPNNEVQQATYEEGKQSEQISEQVPELSTLATPHAVQVGATLQPQFEPRDEFDPELFNRRFRRPEDDLPPTPE